MDLVSLQSINKPIYFKVLVKMNVFHVIQGTSIVISLEIVATGAFKGRYAGYLIQYRYLGYIMSRKSQI